MLNQINKIMNKQKTINKQKIINKLYKEFIALKKGKDIKINIPSISIPVQIYWDSDCIEPGIKATYFFSEYNLWFNAYQQANKVCKVAIKSFNQKIKVFVEKCNQIAKSLGEDKNIFF